MLIDCDTCLMRDLACGDCVITVLLDPGRADPGRVRPGHAEPGLTELDGEDRAALAVLASSGLVPPLRLVTDSPPDDEPSPATSKDGDGTVKRRATG